MAEERPLIDLRRSYRIAKPLKLCPDVFTLFKYRFWPSAK